MDTSDGQVSRDAALIYENFFVPALFAEWAPRVADALEPLQPGLLLDVACGTGVLARELARRFGPQRVAGLDRNEGMLAVARHKAPQVEWRLGRAEDLPFEAGSCAAVASQFGLMFFENRRQALAEMWRVLAPGGRLAVAVWGPLEDTPGYRGMVELLDRLFGAETAAELRAPFCLGDPRALPGLFADAGISAPAIQTFTGVARFSSIRAWVQTDVKGWTLADRLDDAEYALLEREAARALSAHADDDGTVCFASPAHIVSAIKASSDQESPP